MSSMKFKSIILFLITTTLITILFLTNIAPANSVLILSSLFIFLIGYLEEGKKLFTSLGFKKKNINYKNLLIYAPLTAFIILLIYRFLLVPTVTKFTGVPIDISAFDFLKGNLSGLLGLLGFVWVSAAFGEEIVFRGYLMTRFSKIFGNSNLSVVLNILIISTFFGLIHSYQGITGQILSGITGGIIAIIFHFKKNDLWFVILLHGFIDTYGMLGIYFNIF